MKNLSKMIAMTKNSIEQRLAVFFFFDSLIPLSDSFHIFPWQILREGFFVDEKNFKSVEIMILYSLQLLF